MRSCHSSRATRRLLFVGSGPADVSTATRRLSFLTTRQFVLLLLLFSGRSVCCLFNVLLQLWRSLSVNGGFWSGEVFTNGVKLATTQPWILLATAVLISCLCWRYRATQFCVLNCNIVFTAHSHQLTRPDRGWLFKVRYRRHSLCINMALPGPVLDISVPRGAWTNYLMTWGGATWRLVLTQLRGRKQQHKM